MAGLACARSRRRCDGSQFADTPRAAVEAAWALSPRIVVAGSIFLLGDVMNESGGNLGAGADTPRRPGEHDTLRNPGHQECPRFLSAPNLTTLLALVARRRVLGAHQAILPTLRAQRPRRLTTAEKRRRSASTTRITITSARSNSSSATRRSTPTRSSVFYADENRAVATGNVLSSARAPTDSRPIALDFNTIDAARHVLQRRRASRPSSRRRQQPPRPGAVAAAAGRRPGDDRVFLRRDRREARPSKIQDRQRRLHDLRAADAALGSPRRHLVDPEHRPLHAAALADADRQGRPDAATCRSCHYPTKKEDRSTGILVPDLRRVHVARPSRIHNAFFWAIDRSQDATIAYDWFSKVGQGVGTEYRYNLGGGSGNIRAYWLDQRAAMHTQRRRHDGTPAPASQELRHSRAPLEQHAAGPPAGAGERLLLLQHHGEPDVRHEYLRRVPQRAHVRRQSGGCMGRLLAERHFRSQRAFHRDRHLNSGVPASWPCRLRHGTSGSLPGTPRILRRQLNTHASCATA